MRHSSLILSALSLESAEDEVIETTVVTPEQDAEELLEINETASEVADLDSTVTTLVTASEAFEELHATLLHASKEGISDSAVPFVGLAIRSTYAQLSLKAPSSVSQESFESNPYVTLNVAIEQAEGLGSRIYKGIVDTLKAFYVKVVEFLGKAWDRVAGYGSRFAAMIKSLASPKAKAAGAVNVELGANVVKYLTANGQVLSATQFAGDVKDFSATCGSIIEAQSNSVSKASTDFKDFKGLDAFKEDVLSNLAGVAKPTFLIGGIEVVVTGVQGIDVPHIKAVGGEGEATTLSLTADTLSKMLEAANANFQRPGLKGHITSFKSKLSTATLDRMYASVEKRDGDAGVREAAGATRTVVQYFGTSCTTTITAMGNIYRSLDSAFKAYTKAAKLGNETQLLAAPATA